LLVSLGHSRIMCHLARSVVLGVLLSFLVLRLFVRLGTITSSLRSTDL